MNADTNTEIHKFRLRMAMLILAGAVIIVLAGVVVLLTGQGRTVDQISSTLAVITTTLGGIVTTILMIVKLQGTTEQQTQLLSKIDDQTNGILTQKIQSAIATELDRRAPAVTQQMPIIRTLAEAPEGIKGRGVQSPVPLYGWEDHGLD